MLDPDDQKFLSELLQSFTSLFASHMVGLKSQMASDTGAIIQAIDRIEKKLDKLIELRK